MRVPRQPEFGAAEVGEVLLGVERHMRGGEVNVAPRPLNWMRGGKDRGAAHGNQGIDDADT